MKERSQGMILLTTLIMLALIASLLFSMMRGTWIYQKLVRQTRASHEAFYDLEAAASHLEKSGLKNIPKSCIKKTNDLNQPLSILRSEQGCVLRYKNQVYYYVIADLGVFTCLKIKAQASHHWSLAITASELGHEILSLRIAQPAGKRKKICKVSSEISTGVLSWRYVAN
ncbi:MAG: hypothetical protein P1U36_06210 [Legionellaceae bacterium]|nr:hypothetical protein [Legionellaceae bacterium]